MATVQTTITDLPAAAVLTGTELVPVVQNGTTVRTTTGAIQASPTQTQTFLTLNNEPSLANSRRLAASTGVSLTDSGAQGLYTIGLNAASGSLEAAGTGVIVKTGSTTVTARSVAISGSGISVTDGSGVSGNPTLALTGQVLSLANAAGGGLVALTGSGTVVPRSITGTSNEIDVANGSGASNAPTIKLADNAVMPGTGAMTVVTGTTVQQPLGAQGQMRFDSDSQVFQGYASGAWNNFTVAGGVTTWGAGTTGFTPSIPTGGAVVLSGTLAVAHGGTGVTTSTGTTNVVLSNSPVLVTPDLGTPSLVVLTNATGTASGLTAGNVTTNADLTGPITSTGNATAINSQTGTGSTFVMSAAPTLTGTTVLDALTLTSGTISTTPSGSTDIANKAYVDTVAQGLDTKASVVAGTTANITLSGTQTVDGVVLVAADRVLVKNQTAPADNGLYLCAAGAWTRTTDMDNWAEVPGAYVFVEQGTTLADTGWVCTSDAGGTIGVTAITWAQFSGAGSGVSSITFGSTGLTPATATTGAVTVAGTLALTNGGSGQITAQLAMNAFAGAVTSGSYLRGNGTNVVMNTIQVADVPTLNQNTSGTAAGLSATLAIASGGTGQTTAGAAFNALSPITTTGDLIIGTGVNTASRLAIGSNGYLLTSDGTTASWVAAPASGVTTFSAGTTGLTPSSATSGAVTLAGTLAVANGGTGLTSGTSGGILAYTATGTLASSALLAANALMIGGGAGVAPSTVTTGTGVVTALGVNTGSSGAFVVNGGALGTPSSGTVTNLTGTASININGTVGATTPTTGAFTTVTATTGIFGGTF